MKQILLLIGIILGITLTPLAAINFSLTITFSDTGAPAEDPLGSFVAAFFNILKIKAGFSWYLPI